MQREYGMKLVILTISMMFSVMGLKQIFLTVSIKQQGHVVPQTQEQ